MRRKAGNVCMILGMALILAALSLFLYNEREARRAAEFSDDILSEILEDIKNQKKETGERRNTVEAEGKEYLGILSIPSLGLELPVLSEWSYPDLKKTPCRYTGSAASSDLVIMAHNYARHFGRLTELSAGDEVLFLDADGVQTVYETTVVDVLEPTAVEEMASGNYGLTLFTCTYGGKSRVTVRCEEIKNGE